VSTSSCRGLKWRPHCSSRPAESVSLKNERPLVVIATLYSVGLLSREDYDFLREAKRARDVIVHGFRTPDLAPDFVLHLLEKVERRFQVVAA